jgi:hypothetical protein
MTFGALLVLAIAAIVVRAQWFSFAAQRPADYADTLPIFDPVRVFRGALVSEGVIYGPSGRVASRFLMRMEGRWSGKDGTLTEHFRYDSGRDQFREWRLSIGPGGEVSATADDIIGTATGDICGATLRLRYKIRLPKDVGGHVLDVIDWLYLMPDGTLMNRSQMRRFGVTLAELVATMRPVPEAADA